MIYQLLYALWTSGADPGGPGGPVPPFKNFFIYVTIAINIMKIVFNDV